MSWDRPVKNQVGLDIRAYGVEAVRPSCCAAARSGLIGQGVKDLRGVGLVSRGQ